MADFRLSMSNSLVEVNVRIETGDPLKSLDLTVQTRGHDVRPDKGSSRRADGTNGNEFPLPGPTCLSALEDASRPPYGPRPFTWDGTYFQDNDDLSITTINDASAVSGKKIWTLWINFKFIDTMGSRPGPGQVRIKNGDSVLWALIPVKTTPPAPGAIPLKLIGPRFMSPNATFSVSVINGSSDARTGVGGATVTVKSDTTSKTLTADPKGKVSLSLAAGNYTLKATNGDDIASNTAKIFVS